MTTTWTEMRGLSFFGLALALGLAVPAAGAAQTASGTLDVAEVNDRTARMLEEEAAARAGSMETYGEASELYRKAAHVRGDDDARAVEDLRSAARLAHYAGQNEQAVEDFVRAGEIARAQGMASETLEAYLDAASVAQESGQRTEARRIVAQINELVRDRGFMRDVAPDLAARVRQLSTVAG